jgi:hypothetical protein
MITGDRVGAAFQSNAAGVIGGGVVFPVANRVDLRTAYLLSPQNRRFVAFPGSPQVPSSIVVTASSLHLLVGTVDIALRKWEKGKLYISPGGGWARNAARQLLISGSGGTTPVGNAPVGTIGLGYWASASDRLGVRLEVRHLVSAGGTGNISLYLPAVVGLGQPSLAKMPVQNNVVFTGSFTFRLR